MRGLHAASGDDQPERFEYPLLGRVVLVTLAEHDDSGKTLCIQMAGKPERAAISAFHFVPRVI